MIVVNPGINNGGDDASAGQAASCLLYTSRLSDKIAYINHDIDDAIRGKIFEEEDLPPEYTDILGNSVRERLNTMIHDIIYQSFDKPEIAMSPGMETAMHGLRRWMFENVYRNGIAKAEEGKEMCIRDRRRGTFPISFRYILTGSSILTPSGIVKSMLSTSISSSSFSSSSIKRSGSISSSSSTVSYTHLDKLIINCACISTVQNNHQVIIQKMQNHRNPDIIGF